ncbi:MAG: hypothetical protein LRY48_04985 [Bacteroides graminisolvens]|nr:hypothetical protein [Bacteroides graminisolvens]
MGLFEWFNKIMAKDKEKTGELMPWEQDEVDKGDYESHNFEEEDLEEDDYYSEDED